MESAIVVLSRRVQQLPRPTAHPHNTEACIHPPTSLARLCEGGGSQTCVKPAACEIKERRGCRTECKMHAAYVFQHRSQVFVGIEAAAPPAHLDVVDPAEDVEVPGPGAGALPVEAWRVTYIGKRLGRGGLLG
jgi:hypothetical protein